MNVTIFKSFEDKINPHYRTIESVLERIKSGKSKKQIEIIRKKAAAGEDYDLDKKKLPFIVFAAAATKSITVEKKDREPYDSHRLDESITDHSGLFVIDFDKVDVEQKLEQLKKDPYIYACWIAPSGKGVKGLVKCPPSIEKHDLYYTAFLDRYPELDATSRNISRGTFESYDPNIWVNENSLVWDKRITEEVRLQNKKKVQNRRSLKALSTAVTMVRSSSDGIKHESLRNAAVLLGGFIAVGKVKEDEAIKLLEEEIRLKKPKDFESARQTIQDGINYGKTRPLHEAKKLEQSQEFVRRGDGSYDFLADAGEMDEYLRALLDGSLAMGLPTGLNELNTYWLFKKNQLVWFVGADSVGKSFLVWYLATLVALFHGWKVIIHSAENRDGQLRKKLMEFYLGKSVKLMDDEEITKALTFVNDNFRIISSTQMHTLDDFLLKCELIIDEGFNADLIIGEPWNAFEVPSAVDSYRNNIHALNKLRVFKEQYCAVWVADHINTNAARSKDKDGYMLPPTKADTEMGVMKSNKVDDMIIIHRIGNHPEKKYDTQIHVTKVKDEESGGKKTDKDEPVIITINMDYCGYTCYGQDPVKEYWKKRPQ